MSIVYSSTSDKNGLIQLIERNCGFNDGDISGNSTRLAQFTADINIALDKAFSIIFQASGTWQFDDSGHTKYPIIKTNLVANQRDYSFTTDEQSNLILDIFRVAILPSATATAYETIEPFDAQSDLDDSDAVTEATTSGVPYRYDKTANGIFLEPRPSYNATNGLKIYINREASYFTTGDTTKKAGFAGLFHEYLALRPSYQYAYRNNLANKNNLRDEMLLMEQKIKEYYSFREKDVRKVMRGKSILYI